MNLYKQALGGYAQVLKLIGLRLFAPLSSCGLPCWVLSNFGNNSRFPLVYFFFVFNVFIAAQISAKDMTDWKAQISYNYNPSYHAYAYGLVYQPGPEQNHGNLSCWGEAGVTDLSSYNTGVTQAYYATTARTLEESPPGSPEQHVVNGHHHYQGSGVVYIGDTQAGRLLLARQHRAAYDARENEARRAGSDSTSDSEAHTSPGITLTHS